MTRWQPDAFTVDVPAEHREAAEAIREHLVLHRGGAVFLSSSDALRLLDWLDREVPLADVLRAIERAADSRTRNRSRIPLSLGHVSRHLGRPTRGLFRSRGAPRVEPRQERGLAPLVRLIEERAPGDRAEPMLRALGRDLADLPEDGRLAERAMIRLGAFRSAVYEDLSAAERAALQRAARDGLGDLVHLLEERDLGPLVEEEARNAALADYRWLCAATVWDLVGEGG